MAKTGNHHARKSAHPKKTTTTGRRRKAQPESAGGAPTPASDRVTPAGGVREPASELAFQAELVTELATCLWYLKTKYFKKQWLDEESADPDARTRHALRRLDRAIGALDKADVRLVDPTGTRYPPGGEAMMTPLQFEPTGGISTDTVSETLRPMMFSGDRLIQRGEVFVAVPLRHHDVADESKPRE